MAAKVLNVGENKVKISPDSLDEVSQAITRDDIRHFINNGIITAAPEKGNSKARHALYAEQKKKGRHRGHGSRTGSKKARTQGKRSWIQKVRALRDELKNMKNSKTLGKISYRKLYRQVAGNMFHSRRHLREHIERQK